MVAGTGELVEVGFGELVGVGGSGVVVGAGGLVGVGGAGVVVGAGASVAGIVGLSVLFTTGVTVAATGESPGAATLVTLAAIASLVVVGSCKIGSSLPQAASKNASNNPTIHSPMSLTILFSARFPAWVIVNLNLPDS